MSRKPKVKSHSLQSSSPLKNFDRVAETYSVHNIGAIIPIMAPTRGNDEYQRIGRKTVTRSIFIRGKLELWYLAQAPLPAIAGEIFYPSTLNRIMLIVDWQPNGTIPAITDVLEEPYPEAQLNLDNRKRFTVIKDECIVLDPIYRTPPGYRNLFFGTNMVPIKWYEKVHIETVYNNLSNNNETSIQSGAIYMLLIGNATYTLVNNLNQLVVSTRCRFYDENAGTE
jgi:hypothetical protein